MAKDLIIGAASNYTWDKLKLWVNSIKRSGFTGDTVIVGTNMKRETIEKLTSEGVVLSLYGTKNENGDIVAHSNGAPHVERFFYIWNYLHSTKDKYANVITTDTRDVVFQTNPSDWLNEYLHSMLIVASSEGMRYKNEPWNNQNLHDALGPYFHKLLSEKTIYNVGVVAGETDYIKGLMLMLFQISINRPIPIVDQAMYNFIINTPPYSDDVLLTSNEDTWAVNLGTSIHAVENGSGDIGNIFKDTPENYMKMYEDYQPNIEEDGTVVHTKDNPFCIVHQYDRVKGLTEKMEKKYG